MERSGYISRILKEHLIDAKNYLKLTPQEVETAMEHFKQKVFNVLFFTEEENITEEEKIYFNRGLQNSDRYSQFYVMLKMNKKEETPPPIIPIQFQPVTAQCVAFSAVLSIYVGYHLQKFIPTIPCYVKDSRYAISNFDRVKHILRNTVIATWDATEYYMNIYPKEGIKNINKYIINLFMNSPNASLPPSSSNYFN